MTHGTRPKNASVRADRVFFAILVLIAGGYAALILAMIAADVSYTSADDLWDSLQSREIRYAAILSLTTATITAFLSVGVAAPAAYILSRGGTADERDSILLRSPWLRYLLDAIYDLPVVLPPLVVGVSLLILFKFPPFSYFSHQVVYEIPAVILAQFVVACAFAVRTMRAVFDQIPTRQEQVALTLGASRAAAFWRVLLPQARPGLLAAGTLSWARALGEFGPILVFASTTRLKTEVLPTTVYLEIQAGNIRAALAVSLIMILLAIGALVATRAFGEGKLHRAA